MASKDLEKVLNQSVMVDEYDVEFDEKRDTYVVEVKFVSLNDDSDMSEFLKLKNKLRAALNRHYRIELQFKVTI